MDSPDVIYVEKSTHKFIYVVELKVRKEGTNDETITESVRSDVRLDFEDAIKLVIDLVRDSYMGTEGSDNRINYIYPDSGKVIRIIVRR